jgi:hypothetical protein
MVGAVTRISRAAFCKIGGHADDVIAARTNERTRLPGIRQSDAKPPPEAWAETIEA